VEAEEALHRAWELLPGDADISRLRAVWLRQEGRIDEAFASAERAVALAPGEAVSWRELGLIESLRQRPEESAKAYRATLRLAPNDTATKQALATELARAGKADKAREVLGGIGSQGDGATWV